MGKHVKKVIEFDETSRVEYCTGFGRRKNERRKRAQQENEEKAKLAMKEQKAQRKAAHEQQMALLREAAATAAALREETAEPQTFTIGDASITTSTLDMDGDNVRD